MNKRYFSRLKDSVHTDDFAIVSVSEDSISYHRVSFGLGDVHVAEFCVEKNAHTVQKICSGEDYRGQFFRRELQREEYLLLMDRWYTVFGQIGKAMEESSG